MAGWDIENRNEIVLHLSVAEARAIVGGVLSFVPRFHDQFMDTILGIGFDEFREFARHLEALMKELPDTRDPG